MNCGHCNGTGKKTYTSWKGRKPTVVTSDCIVCSGTGNAPTPSGSHRQGGNKKKDG